MKHLEKDLQAHKWPVLNILQWNARSHIANGQEFKKFVDELDKKPEVICIQ